MNKLSIAASASVTEADLKSARLGQRFRCSPSRNYRRIFPGLAMVASASFLPPARVRSRPI